jgi:hypothetical protein
MKDIFESSMFNQEMSEFSDTVMQTMSGKDKKFLMKTNALIKYRNMTYITKMKKINEESYIELNVYIHNIRQM